jgi:putative heme-binding domain-containing protein
MTARPTTIFGMLFFSLSLPLASPAAAAEPPAEDAAAKLFARDNLVAWCIVPFDARKRGPEERAAMLEKLGFTRFAYDWRAEHVPTFDSEMDALQRRHIKLEAFWFPAKLDKDAETILDLLKRRKIQTQLWVTMDDPAPEEKAQSDKVAAGVRAIRPVAEAADKIGCTVALYNHGGWFGEPENQLAIIEQLKMSNVGIVYNLHHGHAHLDRFPDLLKKILPHLWALNLNGMVKDGDKNDKKILPLGQGDLDLELLKTIRDSGYRGPIGILGHTQDDAEDRLRDNLDGLDWLVPQLDGKAAGPKLKPRTTSTSDRPPPAPTAGWLAEGKAEYRAPPLTVECRAKLNTKEGFNILVASDAKQSGAHWEVFSFAGSGKLTAYLPGMEPDHARSDVDICDGKWHDLAMQYEPRRVRLYCDGKLVADQAVKPLDKAAVAGGLAFGRLVEGGIGCDGEIEFVRLARGIRDVPAADKGPPEVDAATIGLWRLEKGKKEVEDQSKLKNATKAVASAAPAQGPAPPTGVQLVPADPKLTAVLIDRSEDDAYMAVKVDGMGQLFVGGREAVFVFEPDDKGGYKPRRELYRFPPDSIIIGLEFRGADLYVLTNNALYLLADGRVKRDGLKPKRLMWGLPLDYHVSFHCLAWGPEGDLYLDHGDPLLNYGDWDRPDHWGCWTLFSQPEETKTPYTGVGGVLRVRPDGSGLRVVAGGLRGPVGLAFGRDWDLFTDDNDHESRPDLYTPARLLHVTPHADFAWPRGWMASKTPDRADLLQPMTAAMGRGVPCDVAYYDEPYFPEECRNSLLLCRWDRFAVNLCPLRPRGSSFSTEEQPFLAGQNQARPVGVAVGRGGRVFVTCLYLSGNVVTPRCYSDLVMVTHSDDPADHPFQPYGVTAVSAGRLWDDLGGPSWERRSRAHAELLRRGGALLEEAARKLAAAKDDDPALPHLAWLAGAGGGAEAGRLIAKLAKKSKAETRVQALRILTEYPGLKAPQTLITDALDDAEPRVQLAALAYFFKSEAELPLDPVVKLACGPDTYLRQTAAALLARRAAFADLQVLMKAKDPATRLAGVLAAGTRLTVPPADEAPPKDLPLSYPEGNAFFHTKLRFADADGEVDLRDLGRVGSYTTAQRWKAVKPTPGQKELFDLLASALDDAAPPVRLQAAYYLSLLRDPRTDPRLEKVRRDARLDQLSSSPLREVGKAWVVGPFDDGAEGPPPAHPPEQGVIDLSAEFPSGGAKVAWQEAAAGRGRFDWKGRLPAREHSSYYVHFRLEGAGRQPAALFLAAEGTARVWLNGRPAWEGDAADAAVPFDAQPGGNDVLIRVRTPRGASTLELHYRAAGALAAAVPEKLDSATLAQRLKEAGSGQGPDKVAPEFLAVDWAAEVTKGDAAQGRKLFGTLGCAKCHAVATDQPGGGAPSLAEAKRRFTVPYVVESVLLPSKQVAGPFRATTLELADGKVVTGLVVGETADALELLLPDASRKTILKKDVEARKATEVSPMPAGLVKTPAELRDLLAYLLGDNPLPP